MKDLFVCLVLGAAAVALVWWFAHLAAPRLFGPPHLGLVAQ